MLRQVLRIRRLGQMVESMSEFALLQLGRDSEITTLTSLYIEQISREEFRMLDSHSVLYRVL